MGEYSKRPLALQLLIGLGGIALGAYSVKAAFAVGASADLWIGIALASLVIVSWGMLPWADVRGREGARVEALLWRLSWFGVLAVIVVNGVSYAGGYRSEQTGGAGIKIEAYEDAAKDKARAETELATLKGSPRWETTKGCSEATAQKSKDYCGKVAQAQAAIAAAAAIKSLGRPGSADAGAETVAWVTGLEAKTVGRSIPLGWALVSDLIASLCLKSVLSARCRRREAQELVAVAVVQTAPAPELKAMPKPDPAVNHAKELADLRWQQARAKKGKQKAKA